MYRIETDVHTHTLISLHAYSTAEECARHAAQASLRGFALTDHCSLEMAQRENSIEAIFNQKVLPREIEGVRVWKGTEIDIVDFEGHLAFEDRPDHAHPGKNAAETFLAPLDVVIASVHTPFDRQPGTVEQNTRMYCAVLENPHVDILGHTGRSGHPFELRPVLETAKRLGKCIEINNASLLNYPDRSHDACLAIATACRDLGVQVSVSSDAHSAFQIGCLDAALALLESISFPPELIVNRTVESFESFLHR